MDVRIQELLDLAAMEGLTLSYPPETIIALEEQGCVVNLRTGAILVGEADRVYTWAWTTTGQFVAQLVAAGGAG